VLSTILGESQPLSKVSQVIMRIDTSTKVFEVANRLVRDMFEQRLGPSDPWTIRAKGWHQKWLTENGIRNKSLQEAVHSQRLWLRDCERLLGMQSAPVVFERLELSRLLRHQEDFSGAEKIARDALECGRNSLEDYPGQIYVHTHDLKLGLYSMASKRIWRSRKNFKGSIRNFSGKEKAGGTNWYMVEILGLLDENLRYERKYGEADEQRLQYPEAF
jgi:hypothetical protein